ncbi:MAG: ribulose-phosphate 3-epimerase [Clostridia bacterium]|nr:ribulose-phosphate 3-epimerase [Clostridia bacterium]
MEIILSPSLLAADFGKLAEQIKEAEKAGAKFLHLDVMDGIFVPNISFGLPVIEALRKYTDMVFDVHLMITEPERYIERFIDAGADIVTFHAEATEKIDECIEIIHNRKKKAGLAISPKTPADVVYPYLSKLDMVLCMTVEPGYGGQKYMPDMEPKIAAVREKAGKDMLLEVDGGIGAKNIMAPVNAGANVIVAGTAVFGGKISENVTEILKTCGQL